MPRHPLLWRGNQLSHSIPALSTGFKNLDHILPGEGWPSGAVIELVQQTLACGELSLLLPALTNLSRAGQRVVMIDPPWIPYPVCLSEHGLLLEQLLLVRTRSRKESLWACEQVVRGFHGGAMLAWPEKMAFSEIRRLQLAATNSRHTVFLFRPATAASASSAAELRLQLKALDGDLEARVLKCRGQRPANSICIRRSQLFRATAPVLAAPGHVGEAASAHRRAGGVNTSPETEQAANHC
jgi:hypothetical protein